MERAGAGEAAMAVTTVGPPRQVGDDLTRTSPHHVRRDSQSLVNTFPAGVAGIVLVPPVVQTGDAVTDAVADMPVVETGSAADDMGDALGCSVSPDGLHRALRVKLTAASSHSSDEATEEAAAAATDAPSGGNLVIDDDCIVV